MAEQQYNAYDPFDSRDESATDQAPETPSNSPAREVTPEQAELAGSVGGQKGKTNKHQSSQKAFETETPLDDGGEAQEPQETLDARAFVDYGSTPDEALVKLEEQGFTEIEAMRLLGVSDRVTHSSEAIEAETTLRRLRFTRWLVERGLLSEFPA